MRSSIDKPKHDTSASEDGRNVIGGDGSTTTNEMRALLQQIPNRELRSRILGAVSELKKRRRFGLVFEEHLPELLRIYGAKVRRGARVARKIDDIRTTYIVRNVANGTASCVLERDATHRAEIPIGELTVVKQFGEPIFPSLQHVESTFTGEENPNNVLIEADNYHALQLMQWLYKGKADCIYIDPPYNTGAKDWKYNNNFVDDNDDYRHSKWLSMMKRRLIHCMPLTETRWHSLRDCR